MLPICAKGIFRCKDVKVLITGKALSGAHSQTVTDW